MDLHVRSRVPLAPLFNEWKNLARIPDSKPPRQARWLLVNLPGQPRSAEAAARALLRRVKRLSKAGLRAWMGASSRIFDIGIQAGITPHSFEDVKLSAATLRDLAQVKGSILVTVYPPARIC